VIVGGWRPLGVAAAAGLFGAADALQLRLQAETFVPRSVWIVLGALILAFIVQRLTLERRRPAYLAAEHRMFTPELAVALVSFVGIFLLVIFEPEVSLPSLLWLAFPYALTIAVLGGLIVRVRQPAALGIPFVRGG